MGAEPAGLLVRVGTVCRVPESLDCCLALGPWFLCRVLVHFLIQIKREEVGSPRRCLHSLDYSDVEHYFMFMAAKENLFVSQEKL